VTWIWVEMSKVNVSVRAITVIRRGFELYECLLVHLVGHVARFLDSVSANVYFRLACDVRKGTLSDLD